VKCTFGHNKMNNFNDILHIINLPKSAYVRICNKTLDRCTAVMKQTIIVIILVAVAIRPSITKRYYVKSDVCSDECNSTDTSVFLQWTTIEHNISRYFISHTDICFLSGVYNLDKKLTITGIRNFAITGRTKVIMKCTNKAGIFINNSISVRIQNIKMVNCGIQSTFVINATSHNFTVAISLLNVQSIVLSNMIFENSLGHGIVGMNILGSSLLKNITMKTNNESKNSSYESSLNSMSGIILVYMDTIDLDKDVKTEAVNVVIDQLYICCMSDLHSSVQSNTSTAPARDNLFYSSIVGLTFCQQTYSINVYMVNIVMTSIASQYTPIVYFEYNSSTVNSVSINNSSITNITSRKIPIVSVTVASQQNSNSTTLFEIHNCSFQYNNADLTKFLKQAGTPSSRVRYKIISTLISENNGIGQFAKWEVSSNDKSTSVIFDNCLFRSNNRLKLQFINIANVTFSNSIFCYNTVLYLGKRLLMFGKTVAIFKQYNEFSFNKADTIITLKKYILLTEGANLNISNNKAIANNSAKIKYRPLIFFSIDLTIYPCAFQFCSSIGNLDKQFVNSNATNFSVVFSNNQKYTSVFHGILLHSCYWEQSTAFDTTTPGDVFERVIRYDTTAHIITRRKATFCYCDSTGEVDCLKDNFIPASIYPGQTIPISLVQLPTAHTTALYPRRDIWSAGFLYHFKPCRLVSYHSSDYRLQFVYLKCIQLFYRVLADIAQPCSAFFAATGDDNTLYHYYIGIKQCPLAFQISRGTCTCNRLLQAAFPTLTCDIETLTLNRSAKTWIGPSQDGKRILYVKFCISIFCKDKPSKLQIGNPDTQCVGNRVGMHCGYCPADLGAVFGSFNCKKCSNKMLGLFPVFFIAGILLVLSLFMINLTVVNGKINGFILYANITIVSSYYVFPSRNILFSLLSLSNLDLGIETCFYHGMTEYGKTWLQFVFPSYLLCIVGVLVITSRYFSCVEKLTRKRVIPVIATIFLLSYNKILLVTAKVLFSYTTVHEIDEDNNKSTLSWSWDSSIPLFGKHFIPLFITSLLVLLFILLPLNFCLVFTKTAYRIKFVSDYFKPYLDAYQAPFKNNHYFYCGIELLIRPITFTIGNTLFDPHKTLAFYGTILVVMLVYLCALKPFKKNITLVLYISYVLNLGCQFFLVTYYDTDTTSSSYAILFNTLLVIALVEFVCTVLYCLYHSQLHKIGKVSTSVTKVIMLIYNLQRKFKGNSENISSMMRPVASFEQLREELLFAETDN